MSPSVFALPVSVEQLAAAIRQMSPADRQRLLDLVPELHQAARQFPAPVPEEAWAAVERVRTEVTHAFSHQSSSSNERFIGELSLAQYLALPDEERARLWDTWSEIDLDHIEERNVPPDALSAG